MSLENDLAIVTAQEKTLRFTRFEEEEAWKLGTRLREAVT